MHILLIHQQVILMNAYFGYISELKSIIPKLSRLSVCKFVFEYNYVPLDECHAPKK